MTDSIDPVNSEVKLKKAASGRAWKKKNKDKCATYRRKHAEAHRSELTAKAREKRLSEKYNLTVKQYEEMLDKQNGRCAICLTEFVDGGSRRRELPNVDHCHDTGKVRGILCNRCNVGIGTFWDSPILLKRGID